MGLLRQIFTWWDGATIGTALFTRRNGKRVGADHLGNIYYLSKKDGRRWVIYNGANDASRIPPEWYSWITGIIDGPPEETLPPAPPFLKAATPNMTGTAMAYRPPGALERGGRRAAASGDYQPWSPD